MTRFEDRAQAGKLLAKPLAPYAGRRDVAVLGLPRGGVPVAYEIAKALHVPLDIFVVRKLGVPGHEELAMGAVASGGVRVLNPDVVRSLGISEEVIDATARSQQRELERRETLYRKGRRALELKDKVVILVDDGLATGASMRAAVTGVRAHGPAKVVVAVPTGSREACSAIGEIVDAIECLRTPEPFLGVGQWYDDFRQTSDGEVASLLDEPTGVEGGD
jgi:putative phosphoribosyl transferase